jgi:hypothetical protein
MRVVPIWLVVVWAALLLSSAVLPDNGHVALVVEAFSLGCITPWALRWAEGK